MSIEYKSGDIFAAPTEAIVNTVNCVGVMGKGIALEFKKRWPKNYEAYKKLCSQKQLKTGQMFVFENSDMFGESSHRFLINFPTKDHWRSKSKLSYVDEGLDDFLHQVEKLGIKSVAIPPLGCGNGGLDWLDVKELIEKKLGNVDGINFQVFAPVEKKLSPEFENIPKEMTMPRAALVKTLGDFETFFGGHFTRLSVQKLTYFLQVLGVNFGLNFEKEERGPFSKTLHSALKAMERGNYVSGYTSDPEEIIAPQSSFAAAEEFLRGDIGEDYKAIIKKLSNLIEGYESPFGLELLSSVYYLYKTEGLNQSGQILDAFSNWNTHKKESFGETEISSAISRLRADSLMH